MKPHLLPSDQKLWLDDTPHGDCRAITVAGVEFKVDRRELPIPELPSAGQVMQEVSQLIQELNESKL